jgi:translation initiation factor 3 subunit M
MANTTSSLFNGFLGSFDELAVELAHYLDTLRKSDDTIQPAIEESLKKEDRGAVLKLLTENANVLNSAPEKSECSSRLLLLQTFNCAFLDIIPAYNLLLHLARQSPNPDIYFTQICHQLISAPMALSQHGVGLTLTILSTIFNIIPADGGSRYQVLQSILKVVRSTSSFDAIRPQLGNLEGWLNIWGVDDDKKRELYLQISDIAKDAGEDEISYKYQLIALRTFTAETASSQQARKLALQALKVALEAPSHFDFQDLTSLDAIQALRRSDAVYFELLELFTSESLDDFNDFNDEHKGWIESEGFDKPALDRKIRLLTLASLAASTGQTRVLPYASIAKALQISEEEVEMWVIDVIRAGLVEGKLSQMNKTFLIHRSTYRVFGDNQWREIAARLDMWKTSLTGVLGVIRHEKANFAAAQEQEKKDADAKISGTSQNQGGGYRNRQPRQQEVEAE